VLCSSSSRPLLRGGRLTRHDALKARAARADDVRMLEEPVALDFEQTLGTLLELVGRHVLVGQGHAGERSEPLQARGVLGAARDIATDVRELGYAPRHRELLVFHVGDWATIELCPEDFVRAIVVRDDEDRAAGTFLTIELRGGCERRIAEWPEPASG
jgi:hypothetical protein